MSSGNKAIELQLQMRQNTEDLHSFMRELDTWETDIEKRDQELRTGGVQDDIQVGAWSIIHIFYLTRARHSPANRKPVSRCDRGVCLPCGTKTSRRRSSGGKNRLQGMESAAGAVDDDSKTELKVLTEEREKGCYFADTGCCGDRVVVLAAKVFPTGALNPPGDSFLPVLTRQRLLSARQVSASP